MDIDLLIGAGKGSGHDSTARAMGPALDSSAFARPLACPESAPAPDVKPVAACPLAAKTFNEGLYNTSLSILPDLGLYVSGPKRPALTTREALAANQALADILDYIDIAMARRLRSCAPGYRCGLRRICALCAPTRARDILGKRRRILDRLRGRLIHITLTTRGRSRLTRAAIEKLIDRVEQFLDLPLVRRAIGGGIVNYHIKHSDDHGGWLVHAHLLLDYRGGLSNRDVERAWANLGDGWSSKVKTIEPGTEWQVLRYGASWQKLPLNVRLVREFLRAVPGFRLIQSWGTAYPTYGIPRPRRARGAKAVAGVRL